jgi:hypothetical protein
MTKVVSALLIFAFCGCLSADVHIIEEMHADAYYYGGVTEPAIDRTTELWIGKDLLAQIVGDMQIIVNRDAGQLFIINHGESTFVECSLPFNWALLVPEETVERLRQYPVQGSWVHSSGEGVETREIMGRQCVCLESESWIEVGDSRYYQTEWKSWFTTDLPIDWALFTELYTVLLQLSNFSDDFLADMVAMKGYPLLTERKMFLKGFARDEIVTVKEISQREAPEHVYTVPDGYDKNDFLTFQELREL